MKQILPVLFLFLFVFLSPKNAFSAFSFKVTKVDTTTTTSIDTEVKVDISVTDLPSESYFVIGWKKGNGQYLGYTRGTNNDWVKINTLASENCSGYTKISDTTTNSVVLITKLGSYDNIENGDYVLKAIRLSSTCKSSYVSTENPEFTINVNLPSTTQATISAETQSPPLTKSIYKINRPKDENGQLLSSVKIYIDNQYINHEDDETINFCNGCFCDNADNVPCNFGEHTIKLTKSNYSIWSEFRNIIQGENYEVTPILTKLPESTTNPTQTIIATQTPTPTPTSTKTPTPTKKVTPTATPSAVLGESTNSASISSDIFNNIEVTPSPEIKIKKPKNYKTPFFIGLFLAISSGALLYFRHRKS